MTGHFDKNLNLRQIILDQRPKLILECGAGEGACTRLLAHMQLWYEFQLYVVSDKELPDLAWNPDVHWRTGISYLEIPKLEDASVGLAIIDTDHNYWTLTQELEALIPKMEEGGLVVMHDVESFYHNTGMSMSYWNGTPYPEAEIKSHVKDGGLGDALIDFLHRNRGFFKLRNYVTEHHGCAVIEKRSVTETCLITPGTQPPYAKPVIP